MLSGISSSEYFLRLDIVRQCLRDFNVRPDDLILSDLLTTSHLPIATQLTLRLHESNLLQGQPFSAEHIANTILDKLNTLLPTLANSTQALSSTAEYPPLFVCYAHQDKSYLRHLQTHLKPYEHNNSIQYWVDNKIPSGADWLETIFAALGAASHGLLLVSPDFLASDFIFQHELPQLLKKKVLWVPVKHSSFKESDIEHFQALYDPERPIESLSPANRNKAWVAICEEVKKSVVALR